jgi:hypothetical protein
MTISIGHSSTSCPNTLQIMIWGSDMSQNLHLIFFGLKIDVWFLLTKYHSLLMSHPYRKQTSRHMIIITSNTDIKKKDYFVTWNSNWEWCQWLMPHKEIDTMTISISRIYKEELSSIFLKFLKLYLVRYCINKYFGFVTVVTSLTCLVLSHVMLKYVSSTNSLILFNARLMISINLPETTSSDYYKI